MPGAQWRSKGTSKVWVAWARDLEVIAVIQTKGSAALGGLPSWLNRKESNAGDGGSIPGSGSSPGEGNGNSLQYSCLGNPVDRGAWWGYSPLGRKELDTT